MKARPSTSIRLASKQHAFGNATNASTNSQHFATGNGNAQTLKLSQTQGGRQFANNRTMEVHNVPQATHQTIQMKSTFTHQQQQ